MEFEIKDGLVIDIKRTEKELQDSVKGSYIAYSKQGSDVGYLRYKVENRIAKIDFLTVSDKDYLGKGVGHTLLSLFESDMKKENVKRIVGVFVPMGSGSARTKQFYQSQGFEFKRDSKTNDMLVVKTIEKRTRVKTPPTKEKLSKTA